MRKKNIKNEELINVFLNTTLSNNGRGGRGRGDGDQTKPLVI
jgi:hypothetical protein